MSASTRAIRIRGASQHNLKAIDVDIPRDRLVVVTGLSGSGKSSLAFDTIYAEGQRKYVESLSTYARQFLEQLAKPEVEHIEGLPPTIAIGQRSGTANPRSTVATTTELYDYLRLLYARLGTPRCWHCDRPITRQEPSQIVDAIAAGPESARIMILAPLVRGKTGKHTEVIQRVQREGFVRLRVDGEVCDVKHVGDLAPRKKHTLEAVVDRLVLKPDIRTRLTDSVEVALGLGNGVVIATRQDNDGAWKDMTFSAHYACPRHPDANLAELSPRLFSFNSPYGACPQCDGLGAVLEVDVDRVVPDPNLTLANGAIAPWRNEDQREDEDEDSGRFLRAFCAHFGVSPRTPFKNLPADTRRALLYGDGGGPEHEGVIPNLQRRWNEAGSDTAKRQLRPYLSEVTCDACAGARLRPEARAVTVGDKHLPDVVTMAVDDAHAFFAALTFEGEQQTIAEPILHEIRTRLAFMVSVGVGYLTLDRTSVTLSGGEAQRIRLATQVGSGLVGVCYVLDEPTIGLHARDSDKLIDTLRRLVNLNNTVIVVEHDEETIRAAEHVIDIGPGAGDRGGELICAGTLQDVLDHPRSITGRYLRGDARIDVPARRRPLTTKHAIEVRQAEENNLKGIDVVIPLGGLVCVTGVSGSGKSSLVTQILLPALKRRLNNGQEKPGRHERLVGASRIDKVIEIDQTPIGRTPRSNPATYTGVFDLVRQVFAKTREAKIRGYGASRFSFNVKGGRCEACQGQGTKKIEMHFLPDIFVDCDVCKGTRYNRETLEIRYRGQTIADVLAMRVTEALGFFENFPKIMQLLRAMGDVGLGYVTLGQSATTLSGGEAQRLKLAAELGRTAGDHTLYVLDEPTNGLHLADIHTLLNVLDRLVELGNTVLVIEHHLDVIKTADWIIDLGPEGGDAGGEVVAVGTPEEIAAHPESYTGRYLKTKLDREPVTSKSR
jgi:excinuclease ABC subunit A